MTEKLERYSDVMTRLVSETLACTPIEWTKGALTIDTDGTRIDYKLKNDDEPTKAVISEKLRDLIDELYVRMAHGGDVWTQAIVTFWREGNNLKFNTTFQYPGRVAVATERPWWKVWKG